MLYLSTRGQAEHLDFSGILLAGLASDGGLYMPESWPEFSATELRALRGLPYPELAARIIAPFVGSSLPFATLQTLCRRAYANFTHPAIVPLVQLSPTLHALELFHGPTLAFKDLALQLAGHLFEHVLAARRHWLRRHRRHRRPEKHRHRHPAPRRQNF
jgi:threonine synthase